MSVKAHHEREKRGDQRAGVIASLLHNIHRDPKRSRAAKAEDYFPSLKPPKREQTAEEIRHFLLVKAASTQGEVKRVSREEYEAMING